MKRNICFILAMVVGVAIKAAVITTINNVSDLQALSTSVSAGDNYNGVTVTLSTDLNLSDVDWSPIGTSLYPFVGTFDGQGHTITNLNVNTTEDAAGLFGRIGSGGVVKDVNIGSGTIAISSVQDENALHMGAIAGINGGTIIGCSNAATVTGASYEHARIGGIAGTNNGSISNCYNLGTVYTSLSNVFIGGIVGYNAGNVKNCFMRSTVRTNVNTLMSYPLYGGNSGTIAGCFYANGSSVDSTEPISLPNNSDNSVIINDNKGKVKNVLLNNRTFNTSGNWNTLCLPFSIAAAGNGRSPIAGTTVKTLSSTSFENGIITLTFADATNIEAGKPYIVKWNTAISDNLSNPVFLDVTVSNSNESITTTYVDFKGLFSPKAIGESGDNTILFLGADNTLYWPDQAMSIPAFLAYFQLNDGIIAVDPVSSIHAFKLDFDNMSTSITNTNYIKVANKDDVWYTLDGRKLSGKPAQRGLYINNGNKVIIK